MLDSGYLPVSGGHEIYYETHGNKHGRPAIALHGGPGGGSSYAMTKIYDLKKWFAPGCFDDFEGTQEELNELIADLKNMVTSGTLWENTLPVDDKEEEELIKLLAQKQARRKQ
jgi:hypothetical protein